MDSTQTDRQTKKNHYFCFTFSDRENVVNKGKADNHRKKQRERESRGRGGGGGGAGTSF